MGFDTTNVTLGDFVMAEIVKMCKSLKAPCGIVWIMEETILGDECLCEDNDYFFDNIMTDIWNYMLLHMSLCKSMTKFDKLYQKIFNNWWTQKRALQNWTIIKNKIVELKINYQQRIPDTELEFDLFFPNCIITIKQALIHQLKIKSIEAIYVSVDTKKIEVVDYTTFSCGGASINKEIKYYEKYKNGLFLPGLKRLQAKPG
eukprot:190919_1